MISVTPAATAIASAAKKTAKCPGCSSAGMKQFYDVSDIPVHSCMLVPEREKALAFPTGDLSLGFCPSCGFISNSLFNASNHDYAANYEETQGFSPRFNSFASALATRIIDRYDIRNKTILEIGCGKGEFLMLMSQLGNNRGIGIDPSYVPGRLPVELTQNIEFIRDFYSESYAKLQADVVCCRHTLEHIGPTGEFLRTVRQSIGDRDSLVFFEVPDVLRVLREGAFWDIYYEHCSYFSPGSLAHLFRSTGFEIIDLELDFNDQYILLMARPVNTSSETPPMHDDLAELQEAVDKFPAVYESVSQHWRKTIMRYVDNGSRVVVWGSSSKGVAFLTTLKLDDAIEYVVDINPYRQGKYMPGTGQKIVSPQLMADYKPDAVIVMNPIYTNEIGESLDRMGITASLLPV